LIAKPDTYPVIELKSGWLLGDEQMGSKDKYWMQLPDDSYPWLFKFSRVSAGRSTGEHWAEKIAAEIAELMEVPHARVELAEFDGHPGSLSQRFTQLSRAGASVELEHGNALLAGYVTGYDRTKKNKQTDHTLGNILKVVASLFPSPKERVQSMRQLAGYLVLDALILNTDRHHENWGVLRTTHPDKTVSYQIAPSFDHASSLARNEPPEKLARWLHEAGRVEAYMRGAHGGIYLEDSSARGANPYTITEKAMHEWPEYFACWQDVLDKIEPHELYRIVDRVPDSMMVTEQKRFVKALLAFTLSKLKDIRKK
jgi:HipA-like C-terminal domain